MKECAMHSTTPNSSILNSMVNSLGSKIFNPLPTDPHPLLPSSLRCWLRVALRFVKNLCSESSKRHSEDLKHKIFTGKHSPAPLLEGSANGIHWSPGVRYLNREPLNAKLLATPRSRNFNIKKKFGSVTFSRISCLSFTAQKLSYRFLSELPQQVDKALHFESDIKFRESQSCSRLEFYREE